MILKEMVKARVIVEFVAGRLMNEMVGVGILKELRVALKMFALWVEIRWMRKTLSR